MRHRFLPGEIVVLGLCSVCGHWIEGVTDHGFDFDMPEHLADRVRCRGADYSCREIRYRADTPDQAMLLARVILGDTSRCLTWGDSHTLDCGDGEHCAEERDRRAKALAEYISNNPTA